MISINELKAMLMRLKLERAQALSEYQRGLIDGKEELLAWVIDNFKDFYDEDED